MARAQTKHGRDQALDFQGFLNDLQDWEMSVNGKDKKVKSQDLDKEKLVSSSQKVGVVGEDRRHMTKASTFDSSSIARQYDYLRNYDSVSHLSTGFTTEVSSPDAASEKEFQEAEDDCTEALNLDDRYIKAYSRRSTARKELGKLKGSMEDAEFALRLEPNNQEIKKQYAEAKSLYDKEMLKKASGALRSSVGVEKAGKTKVVVNGDVGGVQSVSSSSQKMGAAAIQEDREKDSNGKVPSNTPTSVLELESKTTRNKGQEPDASS
ncbi:tetratricopeptide repeat (TPR)-like superfamily protein [Actinidia rufa]|uniref:Tetratricopeptide repeat (TPR)-like superfamily protein n=1 Tax=Actinidia rufa TaxID=165716 RepID=A0A7J0G919_9ERIC|nr:tetratricopeptide repeat (TPR)-like superfamily protein [Actinidia rufa]